MLQGQDARPAPRSRGISFHPRWELQITLVAATSPWSPHPGGVGPGGGGQGALLRPQLPGAAVSAAVWLRPSADATPDPPLSNRGTCHLLPGKCTVSCNRATRPRGRSHAALAPHITPAAALHENAPVPHELWARITRRVANLGASAACSAHARPSSAVQTRWLCVNPDSYSSAHAGGLARLLPGHRVLLALDSLSSELKPFLKH